MADDEKGSTVIERQFDRFRGKSVVLFRISSSCDVAARPLMPQLGLGSHIIAMAPEPHRRGDAVRLRVRLVGEGEPVLLSSVIAASGAPDIVVDDGCRPAAQIVETFKSLFPRMARRGIYLVEDVRTSYANDRCGGLRLAATFVELAKRLVDELNATFTEGAMPATQFSRQAAAILFVENAILFERV